MTQERRTNQAVITLREDPRVPNLPDVIDEVGTRLSGIYTTTLSPDFSFDEPMEYAGLPPRDGYTVVACYLEDEPNAGGLRWLILPSEFDYLLLGCTPGRIANSWPHLVSEKSRLEEFVEALGIEAVTPELVRSVLAEVHAELGEAVA